MRGAAIIKWSLTWSRTAGVVSLHGGLYRRSRHTWSLEGTPGGGEGEGSGSDDSSTEEGAGLQFQTTSLIDEKRYNSRWCQFREEMKSRGRLRLRCRAL